MHVDALDAAARLAGVEHGAVAQRRGRALDVGHVVAHVVRVLAAELELGADHARGSHRRELLARGERSGEEEPWWSRAAVEVEVEVEVEWIRCEIECGWLPWRRRRRR